MKKIGILCFFLTVMATNSFAEKRDYHFIKQAAERWALAVSSSNIDEIMQYYDSNALLAPNCKSFLNTDEKIRNYYHQLIKKKNIEVEFNDDRDIRISVSGKAATQSGVYLFTYEENSQTISIPAQFIFTYAKDPNTNRWMIIAHTSSFMPAINMAKNRNPG